MKHPKPAFKAYIKKRICNTFRFPDNIIIKDVCGLEYYDAGSPHTAIINAGIFSAVLATLVVFNWNGSGFWLVVGAGALILFLHRFLRYFWTNFERVEKEPDQNKSLLYNRRQRIRIFLEAVLALGIVIMIPVLGSGSPYSRLYPVKTSEFNNVQIVELNIPDDGSALASGPGSGNVVKDVGTLLQAYEEARSYIGTFCPEAEIIDYTIELNKGGGTTYHFTFGYFRRGLMYKSGYNMISVIVSIAGNWMSINCWEDYGIESEYSPIDPPDKEIDTERVLDIILKQADKMKDDIERCFIGTQRTRSISPSDNYDPGGDIWYAEAEYKDGSYQQFTVDVSKGTAEEEELN